jgi:hypothetical protein
MILLLLGSGITKLLNISKYETLMTVPSNIMWANDMTDSYFCLYYNVWWVGFNLNCKIRILFGPKKHFKVWCYSEWHICLKIELSQETRLLETIPTAVHMFVTLSYASVAG